MAQKLKKWWMAGVLVAVGVTAGVALVWLQMRAAAYDPGSEANCAEYRAQVRLGIDQVTLEFERGLIAGRDYEERLYQVNALPNLMLNRHCFTK